MAGLIPSTSACIRAVSLAWKDPSMLGASPCRRAVSLAWNDPSLVTVPLRVPGTSVAGLIPFTSACIRAASLAWKEPSMLGASPWRRAVSFASNDRRW